MGFIEALEALIKKAFNFSDRASRSEFWFGVLWIVIILVIAQFLDVMLFKVKFTDPKAFFPLYTVFALLLLIPNISVIARRLHDTNRSGWWLLLVFTVIGAIPLLIWYCTKGDNDTNRFGADPLNR